MEGAPNEGAAGRAPAGGAAASRPTSGGPVNVGAPINQGAAGAGPAGADAFDPGAVAGGQSPLRVPTEDEGPLGDRPEVLVGAAFVGGFALAQILKRLGQ